MDSNVRGITTTAVKTTNLPPKEIPRMSTSFQEVRSKLAAALRFRSKSDDTVPDQTVNRSEFMENPLVVEVKNDIVILEKDINPHSVEVIKFKNYGGVDSFGKSDKKGTVLQSGLSSKRKKEYILEELDLELKAAHQQKNDCSQGLVITSFLKSMLL